MKGYYQINYEKYSLECIMNTSFMGLCVIVLRLIFLLLSWIHTYLVGDKGMRNVWPRLY